MKEKQTNPQAFPATSLLTSPGWSDYSLLDSGNGFKLEKFGEFTLVRPEAEAIWKPALSLDEWKRAQAVFKISPEENGGHWETRTPLPPRWQMQYGGLKFWVQTSASRHLGVFPEQANHWDWMENQIRKAERPVKVLNLFGYTGLASLAAAHAGAQVTHLDASPKVVSWARDNQKLSNLADRPVRWIVDDAVKFVEREIRRGSFYEGLVLDPPKFGRGPKGEVWEFYKLLPDLLQDCQKVLSKKPLFVILTAYAVKASSLTLYYAVQEMMQAFNGSTQAGELALVEKSQGRLLSTAVYARWCAESASSSKE
jgi:23S rRNA (cytosine1962-C5)-methyltransferase